MLPTELKEIIVANSNHKLSLLSVLNSNLFFWFFIASSDCRNVNTIEINLFPINLDFMSANEFFKLAEYQIP